MDCRDAADEACSPRDTHTRPESQPASANELERDSVRPLPRVASSSALMSRQGDAEEELQLMLAMMDTDVTPPASQPTIHTERKKRTADMMSTRPVVEEMPTCCESLEIEETPSLFDVIHQAEPMDH